MVHNVYNCSSCGAYCDTGHDHDILECGSNREKTLYKKCVDDVLKELKTYGEANAIAKAWGYQNNLGIDKYKLFEEAKALRALGKGDVP